MSTLTSEQTEGPGPSVARRRAHAAIPERVDVAIVGSGLGGLVAGAYLAQRGLRVACFDSHYTAGGCATQFSRGPRAGRYHFDVGLHYIGDCAEGGAIPRILGELAVPVGFVPMDQGGFDTLIFPDFRFRIPASLEVYRERLAAMFPREARGIDRYVALVASVMRAGQAMERRGRPPLGQLPRLLLDGITLGPHRGATIADVLSGMVRDERLKAVILGQSGDYGLPPSEVSAMLHLGLAGHYFRGAYYPKGGGQVIADGLAARIEALGGGVHLRQGVERILVRDGRAQGVLLAPKAGEPSRLVRAGVVLSNADMTRTLLELVGPEHLPASWVTRARGFKMAAALFMTFLGVKGDLGALGMASTNYWQFDGYDFESFYKGYGGRGPFEAKGCYITSASLKDPDSASLHAPPGVGNVEVMTVVPGELERWGVSAADVDGWGYRKSDAYRLQKETLEQDMINRLDRLFPGAASRVVFRESATPVSHSRYTRASGGTGYGLAATPDQFLANRPGSRGPLERLYLCGASTRAGHGIVGAMRSGEQAARRILRDLTR
jgi:all-trans-retinol 13,14-reductase